MKVVFYSILGFLGLVTLGLALNYIDFQQYAFYAPRVNQVQNNVFHNSQAYNDGMIRDLENLKREYQSASPEGKAALRSTIIHRFEIYPQDRLPSDLRSFYDSLN